MTHSYAYIPTCQVVVTASPLIGCAPPSLPPEHQGPWTGVPRGPHCLGCSPSDYSLPQTTNTHTPAPTCPDPYTFPPSLFLARHSRITTKLGHSTPPPRITSHGHPSAHYSRIAIPLASLQIDTTPPPPSPAISVATLSNARMMPLPYQLFPARFVLFLPLRSPLSLPHPFQLFAHPVIAVLARGHLKRTSPSSAPSPPLPPSYPAVLPRLAPRRPFLPRFPFRPEGVRQRC